EAVKEVVEVVWGDSFAGVRHGDLDVAAPYLPADDGDGAAGGGVAKCGVQEIAQQLSDAVGVHRHRCVIDVDVELDYLVLVSLSYDVDRTGDQRPSSGLTRAKAGDGVVRGGAGE